MSSNFTARIDRQEVRWSSVSPHLLGSPNLVVAIQGEIFRNDVVMITPTGPAIPSTLTSAEAVAATIFQLYPFAEITDGPDLTALYADAPPDAIF